MEANHVHRRCGKERLCKLWRFSLSAPPAREDAPYQFVSKHYPVFRQKLTAEGSTLPDCGQREFEDDLECGRLQHGFLRVRCETCHEDDFCLIHDKDQQPVRLRLSSSETTYWCHGISYLCMEV